MSSTTTTSERSLVASILMYVQAALIGLTGLSLAALADARRRRFSRRFFHEHLLRHPGLWAIVLLLVAAALVAIGVGIYSRRAWATLSAYVAEVVVGVGGMLGFHPLRSILGLAIAVAVVILVATDRHDLSLAQPQAPTGHAGASPT